MSSDYEPLGDVLRPVGSWINRNVPTIVGWMLIALGMLLIFYFPPHRLLLPRMPAMEGFVIVAGAIIIAGGCIAGAIRGRKA
jgi:hypothetical protein